MTSESPFCNPQGIPRRPQIPCPKVCSFRVQVHGYWHSWETDALWSGWVHLCVARQRTYQMGCGGDPPSPWCLLPLNLNDVEELSVFLDVIHAGNVSLCVLTRAQERQMCLEETDVPWGNGIVVLCWKYYILVSVPAIHFHKANYHGQKEIICSLNYDVTIGALPTYSSTYVEQKVSRFLKNQREKKKSSTMKVAQWKVLNRCFE